MVQISLLLYGYWADVFPEPLFFLIVGGDGTSLWASRVFLGGAWDLMLALGVEVRAFVATEWGLDLLPFVPRGLSAPLASSCYFMVLASCGFHLGLLAFWLGGRSCYLHHTFYV
jgi:hypothetical protein